MPENFNLLQKFCISLCQVIEEHIERNGPQSQSKQEWNCKILLPYDDYNYEKPNLQ